MVVDLLEKDLNSKGITSTVEVINYLLANDFINYSTLKDYYIKEMHIKKLKDGQKTKDIIVDISDDLDLSYSYVKKLIYK